MASKAEAFFEKLLYTSRWLLAPIFLGLALALVALGIKFFLEAWHMTMVVCCTGSCAAFANAARYSSTAAMAAAAPPPMLIRWATGSGPG